MRGRFRHIISLLVAVGLLLSGITVYANYRAQVHRAIENKLVHWGDYLMTEIIKNPRRFQSDPRRFLFSATSNQFTSGTVLVQFMRPDGQLMAKSPSLVWFNLPFTLGDDDVIKDVESDDGTKLKVYQRHIMIRDTDYGYLILGVVVTQTVHNLVFLRNMMVAITLCTIVALVLLLNGIISVKMMTQQQRFLSMTSHDIRTPLAIILGSAEVALKSHDPTEYQHALRIITDEALIMRRLVSDLLTIFRAHPLGNSLHMAWFNWADIVMEEWAHLTHRYPDKHIDIQVDDTPFYADPHQMRQVCRNLLDNACKYSASNGHISVMVTVSRRHASLTVRDNGMGMPPDTLTRIFDPYYQVNAVSEGVGLGLSIVQSIVTAHGGKISVQSTPQQGSTFQVTVPFQHHWWVRCRRQWNLITRYVWGSI